MARSLLPRPRPPAQEKPPPESPRAARVTVPNNRPAAQPRLQERTRDMDRPDLLHTRMLDLVGPQLDRLRGTAIGMAVVGLILAGIGAVMDPAKALQAYLVGWLF